MLLLRYELLLADLLTIFIIIILVVEIIFLNLFESHPFNGFLGLPLHALVEYFRVKHTHDRAARAQEFGMVRIDVRLLNENKILYHLICWLEAFHQVVEHLEVQPLAQPLKSLQLWDFNFVNDSSQFFEAELDALE